MKRMIVVGVALLVFVAIVVGLGPWGVGKTVAAQARQTPAREVPTFEVDPSWPKKLPNNWVWGAVSDVNVDAQDHVWVISRPREVVKPELRSMTAAPPVIEFDGAGNYIQGWGGPGEGYEWPDAEHGINVDYKGYVWIAGRGKDDDQILKFTNTGKFVMQIGHSAQSKGNTDTANLNLPADVTVYPKTNELFVADGYGNRRVIVFDADTGKYKRMWSAFGNVPTDPEKWTIPSGWKGTVGHDNSFSPDDLEGQETLDAEQGPQQFAGVHSVRVSNDGLVYVCDRRNQRVQVFTLDGKYLAQVFISRGKMALSNATGTLFGKPRKELVDGVLKSPDTASRITFSPDPEQRFLYVLDRRHQRILILDRKTLEMLGSFGGGVGDQPGQFYVIHGMSTDSHGNTYTAEVYDGSRAQKFVFKGMASTPTK
jgi:DNA-binding beta-propeller fold protein YncE